MAPYFLEAQLPGAEACRNGHSALSALIGQVKGWLEAGVVSAVPERIRHAFLHVRDYAKMHRGSLQIDFMQTIKPRSVPVVLFLPHHTAPISSSHFFFRQMQHNFGFVYVGSRKQAIDVKIVDESRVLQVLRPGHGYVAQRQVLTGWPSPAQSVLTSS